MAGASGLPWKGEFSILPFKSPKKVKGMPHAVQASTGTGLGTMPCPTVPLGAIRVAQGLLMAPSSVLVNLPLLLQTPVN